jgi:hypothetical protein
MAAPGDSSAQPRAMKTILITGVFTKARREMSGDNFIEFMRPRFQHES